MVPDTRTLRFDGTRIRLIQDRPLRHLSSGIYIPANARGLMAAGMAAEFRLLAGPEVEHELRAHVPIPIGSAVVTGVGALAERGVVRAAHGVTTRETGTRPRSHDLERALTDALAQLELEDIRDITLPLATAQLDQPTAANAQILARILAAHLRRRSRFRSITIAGLDATFLDEFAGAMNTLGAPTGDDST